MPSRVAPVPRIVLREPGVGKDDATRILVAQRGDTATNKVQIDRRREAGREGTVRPTTL